MDHMGSAEKPNELGSRRLAQAHWGPKGQLKHIGVRKFSSSSRKKKCHRPPGVS
ncbi:unnamed protein product [Prunus armeniaca]